MRGEWSPEVGRGESKHPSLPLARAERKPFDQKKKPVPRHQRENQLKEKTSSASGPRGAQSHLTKRKNLPRATSARTSSKKKPALPLARAERKPLDQKKKPTPRHRREKPLPSTSLNKRPKQPLLCRVRVAEPLRVPLDAEAEVRVRLFQRFHNAVLAEGGYF